MQYQAEFSTKRVKQAPKLRLQPQRASWVKDSSPLYKANEKVLSAAQSTEQEHVDWKMSADCDRLIITDLTTDEPETAEYDGGSLLR